MYERPPHRVHTIPSAYVCDIDLSLNRFSIFEHRGTSFGLIYVTKLLSPLFRERSQPSKEKSHQNHAGPVQNIHKIPREQ